MTQVATSVYRYNSDNNQITFDLQLTSDIDENDLELVESISIGVIGAIKDVIEDAINHAGGGKLAQLIISKPIFVVGLTLDTLIKLKQEQALHGNQGLQDNMVAIGQALAGVLIAGATTSVITPILGAGIFATLAGGVAAGLMTDALYESKFFDDGISSASDKLGDFIREFDLSGTEDELYSVGEDVITNLKDVLDSFIADAHTVGDFIQDFFDSLHTAEATGAPVARVDPLTLDLDGDGVELINVNNSTAFFDLDLKQVASLSAANDIKNNPSNPNYNPNATIYSNLNSDGTTSYYVGDGVKEQVGWVKGDDAILTLDKNGNGLVDNILELFGKSNKTGTEELREYDSNNDGVINSSDAVFSQLKLWRDLNGDGISQSGELSSLVNHNITAINLNNLITQNVLF